MNLPHGRLSAWNVASQNLRCALRVKYTLYFKVLVGNKECKNTTIILMLITYWNDILNVDEIHINKINFTFLLYLIEIHIFESLYIFTANYYARKLFWCAKESRLGNLYWFVCRLAYLKLFISLSQEHNKRVWEYGNMTSECCCWKAWKCPDDGTCL